MVVLNLIGGRDADNLQSSVDRKLTITAAMQLVRVKSPPAACNQLRPRHSSGELRCFVDNFR
mgnify:CR=1 FL=1